MTALINASTSSGVVVTSDTSGSLAFQSNGTSIATISSSGLTMNSGNIVQAASAAPAFRYYVNNSGNQQLIANATLTKLTCIDTKDYDTNNSYSTSTSKFQPTVAGYYLVEGGCLFNSTFTSTNTNLYLYKNGSPYQLASKTGVSSAYAAFYASAIIYMNGSTDYVELYIYQASGSGQYIAGDGGLAFTNIQGCMIRSA